MMNDDNENDDEESALVAKGKGKGKGFRTDSVTCARCGKPNHESKNCMLSWPQAQQSLKMLSKNSKMEHSLCFLPCDNCGDPNCEGWVYEDESNDDDDDDDALYIYHEPEEE